MNLIGWYGGRRKSRMDANGVLPKQTILFSRLIGQVWQPKSNHSPPFLKKNKKNHEAAKLKTPCMVRGLYLGLWRAPYYFIYFMKNMIVNITNMNLKKEEENKKKISLICIWKTTSTICDWKWLRRVNSNKKSYKIWQILYNEVGLKFNSKNINDKCFYKILLFEVIFKRFSNNKIWSKFHTIYSL